MPTTEKGPVARPAIVHGDAVKLESLKASLVAVNEAIPKEISVGNDVSALRARRAKLADEIAAVEETIAAYPFDRREAEQAALRERIAAGLEVRAENLRRATEAKAQFDEHMRLAEETDKENVRWRNAPDGLFTAYQDHDRHVARFGDLSGGET